LNPSKFHIPEGYTIAPGGFLLVWADSDSSQNNTNRIDLHANFKLDATGEFIGLYAPDGSVIDQVTFASQTDDRSQGRYADGAAAIYSLRTPTPRGPNSAAAANSPPQIAPLPDKTVTLGQKLMLTVMATDSDLPHQALAFTLEGSIPSGALLDANSGLFTWMPTPPQTPSTNLLTVRVTDNGSPPQSATRAFKVFVVAPPKFNRLTGPVNGAVSLTWQTVPGKSYRVEFKNTLDDGTWLPLVGTQVAGSSELTVADNIGAHPQRFYRIVILD